MNSQGAGVAIQLPAEQFRHRAKALKSTWVRMKIAAAALAAMVVVLVATALAGPPLHQFGAVNGCHAQALERLAPSWPMRLFYATLGYKALLVCVDDPHTVAAVPNASGVFARRFSAMAGNDSIIVPGATVLYDVPPGSLQRVPPGLSGLMRTHYAARARVAELLRRGQNASAGPEARPASERDDAVLLDASAGVLVDAADLAATGVAIGAFAGSDVPPRPGSRRGIADVLGVAEASLPAGFATLVPVSAEPWGLLPFLWSPRLWSAAVAAASVWAAVALRSVVVEASALRAWLASLPRDQTAAAMAVLGLASHRPHHGSVSPDDVPPWIAGLPCSGTATAPSPVAPLAAPSPLPPAAALPAALPAAAPSALPLPSVHGLRSATFSPGSGRIAFANGAAFTPVPGAAPLVDRRNASDVLSGCPAWTALPAAAVVHVAAAGRISPGSARAPGPGQGVPWPCLALQLCPDGIAPPGIERLIADSAAVGLRHPWPRPGDAGEAGGPRGRAWLSAPDPFARLPPPTSDAAAVRWCHAVNEAGARRFHVSHLGCSDPEARAMERRGRPAEPAVGGQLKDERDDEVTYLVDVDGGTQAEPGRDDDVVEPEPRRPWHPRPGPDSDERVAELRDAVAAAEADAHSRWPAAAAARWLYRARGRLVVVPLPPGTNPWAAVAHAERLVLLAEPAEPIDLCYLARRRGFVDRCRASVRDAMAWARASRLVALAQARLRTARPGATGGEGSGEARRAAAVRAARAEAEATSKAAEAAVAEAAATLTAATTAEAAQAAEAAEAAVSPVSPAAVASGSDSDDDGTRRRPGAELPADERLPE